MASQRIAAFTPLSLISSNRFLIFTLLLTILLQVWALYSLSHQTWTGIQTSADFTTGYIKITGISHASPAKTTTQLQPQQILTRVTNGKTTLDLTASSRFEFLAAPTYSALDKLVAQQTQLYDLFSTKQPLTFFTLDGHNYTLTPKAHTPLWALPAYIGGLVVVHLLLPLVGAIVWLYKNHTLEAFLLYLASVSYSLFGAVFCVLYPREFALDPQLIIPLASLGNATMLLLAFSLTTILTYYPQRIFSSKLIVLYGSLWLILALNYFWRWFEIPVHIFIFQFIPIYGWMLWVIYQQWQKAYQNPINRMTLLVMHFSIQVPIGLTILFYALPTMLGHRAYISPLVAHVLIISMFAGWVAGVLRYRLFEAEYWYFNILLWVFGGSLVITSDLLLIGLLKIYEPYALGLALIIANCIYWPVHHWILGRFSPEGRLSLEEFLPTFNAAIANAVSFQAFENSWQSTLKQRFQPLQLACFEMLPLKQDCFLAANGLYLYIPSLNGKQYYQLTGKHLGAHLFGKTDCAMANTLLALARMVSQASEARQQAVLAERQRIMHDLHDTVGARLLTLSHTLPTAEYRQAARDTLHVLRQTIKLSLKQGTLCLEEVLAEWRAEMINRLEAANVNLRWDTDKIINGQAISSQNALEITHILRELVSNALKHAQPSILQWKFTIVDNNLCIQLQHDGNYPLPQEWQEGTGLASVRRRLTLLQGSMVIQYHTAPAYLHFTLIVKLMG